MSNGPHKAAFWAEFVPSHCQFPDPELLRRHFQHASFTDFCDCGCNNFAVVIPPDVQLPPLTSPHSLPAMSRSSSLISSSQTPIAHSKSSCSQTPAAIWITLRSTAVRTLIQFRTSFVSKNLHTTFILPPRDAPNQAMERTADRYALHFLDDFQTSTPSDALSRPPSLILFSLDLNPTLL